MSSVDVQLIIVASVIPIMLILCMIQSAVKDHKEQTLKTKLKKHHN